MAEIGFLKREAVKKCWQRINLEYIRLTLLADSIYLVVWERSANQHILYLEEEIWLQIVRGVFFLPVPHCMLDVGVVAGIADFFFGAGGAGIAD
jgi:hypothetical protein